LGALLKAINNLDKKWTVNILWAFFVFFGFTLINPAGADGDRYIFKLNYMYNSGLDFTTLLSMIYTDTNAYVDLFYPILNFLIAQFTNDTRILFTVFTFIFGFFYAKNIFYLRSLLPQSLKKIEIILFILFIFLMPIWNIL